MTEDDSRAHDKRDSERPYRGFGNVLLTARTNAKIDRRQLADQSGVSYSVLANLESGRRRASDEVLRKISQPLGVTFGRLRLIRDQTERGVKPLPGTGIQQYLRGDTDQLPKGFLHEPTMEVLTKEPDPLADVFTYVLGAWNHVSEDSLTDDAPHDSLKLKLLMRIGNALQDLNAKDLQRVEDFVEGLRSSHR